MNEIQRYEQPQIIRTIDDAERAARAMSASGFFADTRQASQAIVKILAGQELGFGPFASMTGVHIIQNKPVLSANLMAAAVKRTNKYNYRVIEMSEKACELAFFEGGQEVGKSRFTMEDAVKAGVASKDNWKKFPRNMLFARALSNGQKWYAPDVFNGATVYTPDELGAPVDEEGNAVIEAKTEQVEEKQEAPKTNGTSRPLAAETLRSLMAAKVKKHTDAKTIASQQDRQIVAAVLDTTFHGEKTNRYELCKWLIGTASTKDMTQPQIKALQDWLECKSFDAVPPEYVIAEARSAHTAALKDAGQMELV